MKKLTLLLFIALVLTACGPKPLDVVNSWQAALNKGDIDAALSHLADDATVTIIPSADGDGVYNGHAEIRGWYENIISAKGKGSLSNCASNGETMTCTSTYADEGLKAIGVDFIEGNWEAVIRDGKIQSYTFTITPESLAKFLPPPTEPPAPTPTEPPVIDPIVQQLEGKYLTKITLEESQTSPGIEQGDYLLKLQLDMRWFVTDLTGFVLVQGYYTVTADQIVFETKGGAAAGACVGLFGTYAWTLTGETLTLTATQDDCPGGKFFFTIHPFTRQP